MSRKETHVRDNRKQFGRALSSDPGRVGVERRCWPPVAFGVLIRSATSACWRWSCSSAAEVIPGWSVMKPWKAVPVQVAERQLWASPSTSSGSWPQPPLGHCAWPLPPPCDFGRFVVCPRRVRPTVPGSRSRSHVNDVRPGQARGLPSRLHITPGSAAACPSSRSLLLNSTGLSPPRRFT